MRIFDSGLLDMPPFPPGLSRSQAKRERAAASKVEGVIMDALAVYCSFENFCPRFVKAKLAHIGYVIAVR
jgi:hypothetical protein